MQNGRYEKKKIYRNVIRHQTPGDPEQGALNLKYVQIEYTDSGDWVQERAEE
jgi:hypothetical protein